MRRGGRRSTRRCSGPSTNWVADADIEDDTWSVLAAELDRHQLMDRAFTVGAHRAAGDGVQVVGDSLSSTKTLPRPRT